MEPLEEQKRIDLFRKIYRSLHVLGNIVPGAATPAIASMRLLLMEAVGEEYQRELIAAWNTELDSTAYPD